MVSVHDGTERKIITVHGMRKEKKARRKPLIRQIFKLASKRKEKNYGTYKTTEKSSKTNLE
jgi:hypothetical protein